MQAVPQKVQNIRFDWMFSPWQDLLYFFLPVPFTLMLYLGAQQFEATNALLYTIIVFEIVGFGAFHQGATWFHFLDKENRKHYFVGKKGILDFVVQPLFLFVATVVGEITVPALTFFIYICWSLNHAIQQNIGIMLLYQNSKTNEAKIPRAIQSWSQRLVGLSMALVFFRKQLLTGTPLFEPMMVPIAITAIAGIAYSAAYIWSLGKELAAGKHLNAPSFLFWLLCVTYLVPFAFLGKNYDDALMIPLMVHWCQYIGINFVVAKRKYQGEERIENIPLKKPILLYIISGFSLVFFILTLTYFQKLQGDTNLSGQLLKGIVLGFGMVHYYLDGFIWRFRDKFPREAMLPYLVRPNA